MLVRLRQLQSRTTVEGKGTLAVGRQQLIYSRQLHGLVVLPSQCGYVSECIGDESRGSEAGQL
jgi:hypothetical protein